MTNGNDSAYAEVTTKMRGGGFGVPYGDVTSSGGLTKREAMAMAAMQGLIASTLPVPNISPENYTAIPRMATEMADALIEALNAPVCPDCKGSNADGHYDAVNSICPTYERAISER